MSAIPAAPDNPEYNPLAQRFTAFPLIRFALPTICMMLFFGLYTIVDTMFIARFVNTNALSALNIVTPVINVIVGLGTMLAAGASAVVARKLGTKNLCILSDGEDHKDYCSRNATYPINRWGV